MSLSIIDAILLIGAAQGLLLATLIFHKYRAFFANRFLGLMMLFYGIIFFDLFFGEVGVYERLPRLQLVLSGIAFLVPPLHYFYAKSLIHCTSRLDRTIWLHLLPFVVYKLILVPDFFLSTGTLVGMLHENERTLPMRYLFFNWAVIAQGLLYMGLTIGLLQKYARGIKELFSTTEKVQLNWLRNITLLLTCVFLSFLTENVFLLLDINLSNFFNFSSLLGAVSVYVMGYLGISKSGILSAPDIQQPLQQMTMQAEEPEPRYQKSGLSSEKADTLLAGLLELMQREMPFRDSNLTLPELAARLSISAHNLSEVINTRLYVNFFDFINQYRVEAVKKDLADPKKQNLTLLAIAFDAGFNSKTAFNTIFKKHTGQTPSQYRQLHHPKSAQS